MKKLLALLLSLVMLLSVTSFAAADEEPLTVTVMLPDFYTDVDFMAENNPVLKAIEEKTGIRLDIQWVANSNYTNQTNLTLGDPNNMPMLMALTGARDANVINSARAGAFWDLTDYIPQYENLAKGSAGVYNNISVDGRIYGIYRARAMARAGIYYRKDIAEKVGITEEPKTMEDLTKLAYALADYSDDSYALNMVKYVAGTINIITVAMGAPFNWGVKEDGTIYPAHEDPAFLKGLNWLRDLYAYGGIDPDFMTIESGNWDSIERTDKAFMRFDCMDNSYRQQEWFEKNKAVTDVIFAMVPSVTNENGDYRVWPQNSGYQGEIVVTKAVKDEATLKRILTFLDWCNTPEGCTLVNWGLDGLTYWMREEGYMYNTYDPATMTTTPTFFATGNKFRYTNPTDDADMSLQVKAIQHSMNQLGMNVNGDLSPAQKMTALRAEYADLSTSMIPYCITDPCHPFTSETYVMYGTQLATDLEDAHVQYIAGLIDEAELRAAWQRWSEEGGAQIAAEYTEAYKASLK